MLVKSFGSQFEMWPINPLFVVASPALEQIQIGEGGKGADADEL